MHLSNACIEKLYVILLLQSECRQKCKSIWVPETFHIFIFFVFDCDINAQLLKGNNVSYNYRWDTYFVFASGLTHAN